MRQLGYLIILILSSTLAHAANPNAIHLNINSAQKLLTVNLKANPSTGFTWSIKSYDQELLKLIDSTYKPSSDRLGSDGDMIYVFSILKDKRPANTKLVFVYARPWEADPKTVQKIIVNFLP